MQGYEYQSEFARKYYGQGKQEGFAEGLSRGKTEGKIEGKIEGEARAILAVLTARRLEIPEDVRTAVLACTDLEKLDAWVKAAVTVPSAEALLEQTPAPQGRRKSRKNRGS
jgi:predicted transposase YdaD